MKSEGATPPRRSLKRLVQRVSLRTKIVVPMVTLAVAPTLIMGVFTITRTHQSLRDSAIRRVEFDTASKARMIQDFLEAVQQDLRFLSRTRTVRDLIAATRMASSARFRELRREVEREFVIFSQGKRAYYQVRCLNDQGDEIVRLNVQDGLPLIVPLQQLQNKGDRYYVQEALRMEVEQIYASPMDLNMERGEVEVPHRAVVRYATTVRGSGNQALGILIINIHADYLFSLAGPLPSGTETWLVDGTGRYLGYIGESERGNELYGLAARRNLSADYTPEEIATILDSASVGRALETDKAFLSCTSLSHDSNAPDRQWTLMVAHPRAPIEAPIHNLTFLLSAVMVAVALIAGGIGVFVGHYLARPVESLRRATKEIAAGNLSKRVEITTGDEIEGLAIDFNAMTQRLREAQERQAGWNEELEREVTRQTEELHRLQAGLANADKLALIGQMTAGVMHEIGNPLAAVKTKIQVTQETGELTLDRCRPCLGMMDEIIAEVNRLASFLRSFSRLARLREPQFEPVSLSEMVQGVIALVTPEVRTRGMTLQVELGKDVPTINGDADQLRQLLINLILNAADATPEDGEIHVKVYPSNLSSSSPQASIEITDHGMGIPPQIIEKVWDPFFTTKPEGTGLGLAICRQIVRDHGGTISIQSEREKGTVVAITFPSYETKRQATPEGQEVFGPA